MFCSNCGKEVTNDAKFCLHCGEKIVGTKTTMKTTKETKETFGPHKIIICVISVILVLIIALFGIAIVGVSWLKNSTDKEQVVENVVGNNGDGEMENTEQSTILENIFPDNPKEEVVEFQDPLVERCVRKKLGKSYDEKITVEDCKSIKSLLIDCKYDVSFSAQPTVIFGGGDLMCNYIDFSDFVYLTELGELYIDNQVQYDLIVNFDTIKHCKKLQKISMEYNPMQSFHSGDIPRGYKYLKDIIDELPNLEYIDLGYYVPGEFRQMLKENNSNLIISEGEEFYYSDYDVIKNHFVSNSVNWQAVDTTEDYMTGWDYVYDGNKADSVKAKSILRVESLDALKDAVETLPPETEDIILHFKSPETIDVNIFTKFKSLHTLTIVGNCSFDIMLDGHISTPVENIGELKTLPHLFALNLAGCTGDFSEIGDLVELKELSLTYCEYPSCDFLKKLKNLKELTVLESSDREEKWGVHDVCEYVEYMPELKFLATTNETNLKGIENSESLETLRCWNEVTSLEYIGECKSLKNIILNGLGHDINLDMTPLDKLEQLEVMAGKSTCISNVEGVLDCPNLITLYVNDIEDVDDSDYHIYMDQLLDMAIEKESLSYFNLMAHCVDGRPFGSERKYNEIDLEKLWEAEIFDGLCQRDLHFLIHGDERVESYHDVYVQWKYN